MRQANQSTLALQVMALAVAFAASFGTNDAHAQRVKDPPSYTLHLLGLPTGFASASRPASIPARRWTTSTATRPADSRHWVA